MAKTLQQLINNCADRGEIDNLTDAEWTVWINDGRLRLRDLLAATSQGYFESTQDPAITTVAGTETYALPSDFLRLLAVEVEDSDGYWHSLEPYRHGDRNVLRNVDAAYTTADRTPSFYSLRGDTLSLLPTPASTGNTVRVRYLAVPTALSDPATDSISGIEEYFSEFIEVFALLQAAIRLERDTLPIERMLTRVTSRVNNAAPQRDSNAPRVLGSMLPSGRYTRGFRG